jgi:hypothetical protein
VAAEGLGGAGDVREGLIVAALAVEQVKTLKEVGG